MTLKELITVIVPEDCILTKEDMTSYSKFRDKVFYDIPRIPKFRLCFESEDETHIEGLAAHPMFIPYYDFKVYSLDVRDEILWVWIDDVSLYTELRKLTNQKNQVVQNGDGCVSIGSMNGNLTIG